MVKKMKYMLSNLYMWTCRVLFGVKRKRILFLCFAGRTYADNSRAVSEAVHKLYPEIEIVWLFNDPESKKGVVPEYVKMVKNTQMKFLYYTATSGCLVSNNGFYNFRKSKKQFLVQLWHGDRAIKKILYDSHPDDTNYFCPESQEGFCDLAVSGSDFCDRLYRSAFRYSGEILKVGSPRDDVLVNGDPERAKKTREFLGISEDKKILIYAPTFRRENSGGKAQQKQDIDLERALAALEKKMGGEWVCLVRSHPVAGGIVGFETGEKFKEVSKYEDMADLLLISDVLITDYSSSSSDFTIQNRPTIIFQPDRKDYIENSRALYFDMDETPFMVAQSQQELEKIISELTPEKITENCRKLAEFYGIKETGKSSEETAKKIYEWMTRGKRV